MDSKNKKNGKKKYARNRKHIVIMLAAITAFVWILFLFGKIIIAKKTGAEISAMQIVDSIFDNILGILPPIIIFNFAFEYLSQDYVSEEISEQITATLMSNPDTIKLFEDETKRNFLKATVSALSTQGTEESDMAINAIVPYINSKCNLRKYFSYSINLRNYPDNFIFSKSEYMMVCETLKYQKQYIANDVLGSVFKIGFFVENKDLDKHLRGQDYLVREALCILPSDMARLINMSEEEKMRFVVDEMALKVNIDRRQCKILSVTITDVGIDVELYSEHDSRKNQIFVDVVFCMPQLKNRTVFLASVTEPTYGLNVQFSYPREMFEVKMYPFFNDNDDALVEESDRGIGNFSIDIHEKWVYPMSGVVFVIDQVDAV